MRWTDSAGQFFPESRQKRLGTFAHCAGKKEAPQFRPNRTFAAVGADSPKSCTRTATHATGGSNPSTGNPGDDDEKRSAGWD